MRTIERIKVVKWGRFGAEYWMFKEDKTEANEWYEYICKVYPSCKVVMCGFVDGQIKCIKKREGKDDKGNWINHN